MATGAVANTCDEGWRRRLRLPVRLHDGRAGGYFQEVKHLAANRRTPRQHKPRLASENAFKLLCQHLIFNLIATTDHFPCFMQPFDFPVNYLFDLLSLLLSQRGNDGLDFVVETGEYARHAEEHRWLELLQILGQLGRVALPVADGGASSNALVEDHALIDVRQGQPRQMSVLLGYLCLRVVPGCH